MTASRKTAWRPLRWTPLAAGIFLAFGTCVAVADEQDGDKKDKTEPAQLEPVRVTAQRRVEDERKVPISITTVADENLHAMQSGGEDIRYLAGRLPSLNIESSFGRAFPRFYIRGLGNTDFDLNASQPVSLIYDEVVQENPILKGFPAFDLEQIELLRGPQGTLFGRNTPAGVVKFESRKPTPDADGYGQISYGRYGTVQGEGAFGGPLGENWSARVSGIYQHRDDWVDNAFTHKSDALEGYDEHALRMQLMYQPKDGDFTALFNVHERSLDGTARLFRANIIAPGSEGKLVDHFDPSSIAIDGRNKQTLDGWGGNAQLTWNLGTVSLYSITGYETVETYSRGDIDGGYGAAFAPPSGPGLIPFPAESADGLPDHRQITQELRLQSNDWGRFDWQGGLYYFDEDISIDSFNYDTLAGGVQNGYARQQQRNKAWAGYFSGDYDFTDQLTGRAGVRYTHDTKDFVAQRFQSPIGAPPTDPLRANPSDSDVSWDGSLNWAATTDTNFYGRVAKGFRAPSIQGRLLFGDSISIAESETVTSYEAGIKSDMMDHRARIAASVFHYIVHNQQLTAVGGQANFNRLINAKESEGNGFELDASAYFTPQLLVTLGTSYNDTRIHDKNLAIQPCGAPCTVLDPAGPVAGTVLIDGNHLPQAPVWIGNLTARYSVPLAGGNEFYVLTDWSYRGDVSFFLYDSKEFHGPALTQGGLRFGYNFDNGHQELALYGRNITNRIVVVGGIDFNNLTGFINDPRFWGLEYSAKF
jgi:iron complex outermembrane receptor protein